MCLYFLALNDKETRIERDFFFQFLQQTKLYSNLLDNREEKVLEKHKAHSLFHPFCLHIRLYRRGSRASSCAGKQVGRDQARKKKQVTFCFTFSITKKKHANQKTNTQNPRCRLIRNPEVIHGTNDEMAQEREKNKTKHPFLNCITVPLLFRK